MKKIIVSSSNPVKINSTEQGFARMFPDEEFSIESVPVPSGVPDQPIGTEETLQGAINRARVAADKAPGADFYVGIEGGITPLEKGRESDELNGQTDDVYTSAWVVVISKDKIGKARTTGFFLPQRIISILKQGKELGDAANIVFNGEDIKRKNGTIGMLTGDISTRTSHYISAVILALIPFKNPSLY